MRFNGMVLVASAIMLGACGGGGGDNQQQQGGDTAAAQGGAAGGAATGGAAGGAGGGSMAAITGTTHTVRMLGDEKGYRFEPANITIKQGDGVRWLMVSGGPHNVAFEANNIPAAGRQQLAANMPNQQGELSSPMFMNPNEEYTVSFANAAPGQYNYNCTPHLAMGMRGVVTVQ